MALHNYQHDTCDDCAHKLARLDKTFTPEIFRGRPSKHAVEFDPILPFLTILGATGTWKSHAAYELVIREAGRIFKFPHKENCADVISQVRCSWRGQEGDETERKIIQRIGKYPLLLLDDMGAEKINDTSISALYLILDMRYERKLRTVVTSNLTMAQIAERIDDRIASRLERAGKVVTLK